eukprot:5529290-Prymnesium_polylepis.2
MVKIVQLRPLVVRAATVGRQERTSSTHHDLRRCSKSDSRYLFRYHEGLVRGGPSTSAPSRISTRGSRDAAGTTGGGAGGGAGGGGSSSSSSSMIPPSAGCCGGCDAAGCGRKSKNPFSSRPLGCSPATSVHSALGRLAACARLPRLARLDLSHLAAQHLHVERRRRSNVQRLHRHIAARQSRLVCRAQLDPHLLGDARVLTLHRTKYHLRLGGRGVATNDSLEEWREALVASLSLVEFGGQLVRRQQQVRADEQLGGTRHV